jgi:hypothetical protein
VNPNPLLRAWKRRLGHQLREGAGFRGVAASLAPVVALGLAGPLVQPVFMWFLESNTAVAVGLPGLGLRLGLLLAGAMALATYSALVRGPERRILDPHPAQPEALLRYLSLRTGLEHLSWVLAVAAFLLPVLLAGHTLAWGLGIWVAFCGWWLGLAGGFTVHLGSVWAAESPGLAGLLNLIRGSNPKLQAALIYGPGVVLALGALGVWLGSTGARLVLLGDAAGWVWLLAPLPVGVLAWLPGPGLARGYHVRTTLLLAEIDAAYAGAEDPEDARRVYLEWAVRLLPGGLRVEALKELRHGWRGLRSWITGAWGLGLLAALSGWSSEPEAFGRTLLIAGAGLVALGLVGLRLAATDPTWLEQAIPHSRARRLLARGVVVFGWLQGCVVPPFLALGLRQGAIGLHLLALLEGLALALALISSGSSRWRGRGLAPYLFVGLLLWAGLTGALS